MARGLTYLAIVCLAITVSNTLAQRKSIHHHMTSSKPERNETTSIMITNEYSAETEESSTLAWQPVENNNNTGNETEKVAKPRLINMTHKKQMKEQGRIKKTEDAIERVHEIAEEDKNKHEDMMKTVEGKMASHFMVTFDPAAPLNLTKGSSKEVAMSIKFESLQHQNATVRIYYYPDNGRLLTVSPDSEEHVIVRDTKVLNVTFTVKGDKHMGRARIYVDIECACDNGTTFSEEVEYKVLVLHREPGTDKSLAPLVLVTLLSEFLFGDNCFYTLSFHKFTLCAQ